MTTRTAADASHEVEDALREFVAAHRPDATPAQLDAAARILAESGERVDRLDASHAFVEANHAAAALREVLAR